MAFTVQDYNDFVQLLATHPEWRPELRRLVLADELLDLPRAVLALTEAQRHTDAQLAQLTDRVDQLTEAQRHTDAQLAQLTDRVDQLTEAQRHTDAQLAQLTDRVDQLIKQVDRLTEAQQNTAVLLDAAIVRLEKMTDRLGNVSGTALELRCRDHAAGYFGQWLKRARAVPLVNLEEPLESHLSENEVLDLMRLDLLIQGQRRDRPGTPEAWLAVEVAYVVNEGDVDRAQRRATLLRQAGYTAIPVVAGEELTSGAEDSARIQRVAILKNGSDLLWEEAVAKWGETQTKG